MNTSPLNTLCQLQFASRALLLAIVLGTVGTWGLTPGARARTIEVLGTGTAALLGGDLTDPENDGNEAAGPSDPSWNWRAITSNIEAGFGGGEFAFNIFDNRVGGGNDKWCCDDPTSANPYWVDVEFPQPVRLTHLTIASGNDAADRDPLKFQIQGSNDGVNYEPIYTRDSATSLWTERNQVLKITLPQPAPPFAHIRYWVTDTAGPLHQLNEIEYFGTFVPFPFTVDNRFNPRAAYLVFDNPIDPATVVAANFTVAGLAIQSLELQADGRTVVLTTAQQVEGQTYPITVQGVLHANGDPLVPSVVSRSWTHGAGVATERIIHEQWKNIEGTTTDRITSLPAYSDRPDVTTALPLFEIPVNAGDDYGGRIYGTFIVPSTGSYTFYICSDDQSQLFLSTDGLPAHKVEIAREPNWNGSREYIAGSNQATRGFPPANVSAPVLLAAGTPVWLELIYKEGTGGDNASVAAEIPGGPPVVKGSLPLEAKHFAVRGRVGPDGSPFVNYGPVTITKQPVGASVVEGAAVTLEAEADGSPPHRWQWRRNGVPVPGATGRTHTFAAVPGTDGTYTVALENDFSSTLSQAAVVNVAVDTTAPLLLSARGTEGRNRVRVRFTEPVDTVSATDLANYSLTGPDGPLVITGAQLVKPDLVELQTAKQAEGALLTLVVNNVTDASVRKNPIAPDSRAQFRAFVFFSGFVLHRRWNGVNTIEGLKNAPGFPDAPDSFTLEPLPEYPPNGANEAGTGYGNLLTFWWTPPETGDYEFFVCSDDRSELWLSTDDDPANRKLIAIEPVWNNPRTWVGTTRRDATFPENRSTKYQASQWSGGPGPIHLVAGQRYFVEAVHAEGDGGDNVGVTVNQLGGLAPVQLQSRKSGVIEDNQAPFVQVDRDTYGFWGDQTGARLEITDQPKDQTTTEGGTATFTVKAFSSLPGYSPGLSYHWQCAAPGSDQFETVPSATGATYTTPPLTLADSGRRYRCIISLVGLVSQVPELVVSSEAASLTVLKDTVAPRIGSVIPTGSTSLRVACNETLKSPPTCSLARLDGGAQVPIATITAGSNPNEFVVDLTEPWASGEWYILRCENLCDERNNCRADEFCFRPVHQSDFPESVGTLDPLFYLRLNGQSGWLTTPNTGSTGNANFGESKTGATLATATTAPHTGGPGPTIGTTENRAFVGTGSGGNKAFVEVQGSTLLNHAKAFAIGFWVKLDPTKDTLNPFPYNTIVNIPGVGHAYLYQLFGAGASAPLLFLNFVTAVAGTLDVEFPYDGAWHFVVLVATGERLEIYIDRVLAGTGGTAAAPDYGAQTGHMTLGFGAFGESHHLDGGLDEYFVLPRAATANEVANLYDSATQSPDNQAPAISGLPPNLRIPAGQVGTATGNVTDPDTPIGDTKVVAHSGSPSVLPDSGIIVERVGTGNELKVTLKPVAAGTAVIRITVFDGTGHGSAELTLTVTPPPVVSYVEPAEDTANVTVVKTGSYSVLQSDIKNGGNSAFHLAHPTSDPQWVTLNPTFLAKADSSLEFQSLLALATPDQRAVVEVWDGEKWVEVDSQRGKFFLGSGGSPETSFNLRKVDLGQFAGKVIQVRFCFVFAGFSFLKDTGPGYGRYIDDIKLFNVDVMGGAGVNDAPSFTKGADQTLTEDAGTQNVPGWATGISAGEGETGQTVKFLVTIDKPELFSQQPAITADGTLTYTPAPNANGVATVTVVAMDDGGTANGGVDMSPPQTFTITINGVNDAPNFTKGADQTVNENTGAQTVARWATGINPGEGESEQAVTFVVSTDKPELFSQQPTVSPDGTLTYTPAPNASGTATVTVVARDDGGSANGGVDVSAPQTFTITVTPVPKPIEIQVSQGRLPTNDRSSSPGNEWVSDWELAKWIDKYFEDGSKGDGTVESNIIFLFTLCYGGDFLDNLNGGTGEVRGGSDFDCVSFSSATKLTVNQAGGLGVRAGAGSPMVDAAKPGARAADVHQAGVDNAYSGPLKGGGSETEIPQIDGANFKRFGGSSSTHVLVWAGLPDPPDRDLIQKVVANYAGHPNTSIIVLSGDSFPESSTVSGTPLRFGPATRANLEDALKEIGAQMDDGPDEQFVFFGCDHGNLNLVKINVPAVPKGSGQNRPLGMSASTSGAEPGNLNTVELGASRVPASPAQDRSFTIPDSIFEDFLRQSDAVPSVSVATELALSSGQESEVRIRLNARLLGSLADATKHERVLPGGKSAIEYEFALPRDSFQLPDFSGEAKQSITIENSAVDNFTIAFLSLNLGAIAIASPAGPPHIAQQPQSQSFAPGADVTFEAKIPGATEYQWRKNGEIIPGANGPTLTIPNAQIGDGGSYTVAAANDQGAVQSDAATLTFTGLSTLPFADNFADRGLIEGASGMGTGSNRTATKEAGESNHAGKSGGKSVWLKWRAPANGIATFKTTGSTFDTLLAVYRGASLVGLTEVASDEDSGGFFTSLVRFNAEAGVEYAIAVDGFFEASGDITLAWDLETTAEQLPVIVAQPTSQTVAPGSTALFQVTVSPADGNQFQWLFNGAELPGETNPQLSRANAQAANVGDYAVRVTRGNRTVTSRLASLQLAAISDGPAGQTPRAYDKFGDAYAAATGQVQPAPVRGIRQLAAAPARGFSGHQVFSSHGATTELGEPLHCDVIGGASMWFAYEAAATATLTVETKGSSFDTVLAVYTGTGADFEELTPVACNNDSAPPQRHSRVSFPATAGTIYYIAVDGVAAGTGVVQLSYSLTGALRFLNPRVSDVGGFSVRVTAPPNRQLTIQVSEDLVNWRGLRTVGSENGEQAFQDSQAPTQSKRFYRVILEPAPPQ
jgi:hypothetical protein